jgi:hypothetical protein
VVHHLAKPEISSKSILGDNLARKCSDCYVMESVGGILCPVAIHIPPFSRETCDGCNDSHDSANAQSSEQYRYPLSEAVHQIILAQRHGSGDGERERSGAT